MADGVPDVRLSLMGTDSATEQDGNLASSSGGSCLAGAPDRTARLDARWGFIGGRQGRYVCWNV